MYILFAFIVAILGQQINFSSGQLFSKSNQVAQVDVLERAPYNHNLISNRGIDNKTADTTLRCGHVSNHSNGGVIFYKPFEQVFDNERCVWIIAAPRAIAYVVNIQYLGNPTNQPQSKQELILSGIGYYNGSGSAGPIFKSIKPTALGFVNVTNVNILMVTFWSSSVGDTSTGFALDYQEVVSEEDLMSPKSTHHIFETTKFSFKYPVEDTYYDNKELASFVFVPKNNLNSGSNSTVWYKGETICEDFLHTFKFNADPFYEYDRWTGDWLFCSYHEMEIVRDDMILFIFTSDETEVTTGFQIQYVTCPL